MNKLARFYNNEIRYAERKDNEGEYTLRRLYVRKLKKYLRNKLKDISQVIKENENN